MMGLTAIEYRLLREAADLPMCDGRCENSHEYDDGEAAVARQLAARDLVVSLTCPSGSLHDDATPLGRSALRIHDAMRVLT